ncbi:hypothetical protein E4U58_007160 [Claviceps cyperi]|nr:hypothetical protein E4U58_007160 [Claviceps cyperi]
MQLLSAIFVAIAAQGALVNARPADKSELWCNHGTGGNGGCEANGLHTYCCNYDQTDFFDVLRHVTVASQDGNKRTGCDNNGIIFCS